MRQPKRVCSVLVILSIICMTSTLAISTGKKATKTENGLNEVDKTAEELLPSPTPSPSPSTTTDTEFASRLGTTVSKKEDKPVVKKFKAKNKNSTAAASTKSSHVAFPENDSTRASPEEGKEPDDPVVLELLDEKERGGELADSEPEGEGRANKYPRIYYGEALPHNYGGISEDEEGAPLRKHQQEPTLGDHNPKYFYPKSYVHNKNAHKGSKNKKKFEYKYEGDTRQLEDPYHGSHEGEPPSTQQTPDLQYHGPDHHHHSGKENVDGFEQDGNNSPDYGYGGSNQNGPSHFGHYGRDAADIISKALHVLIPSALLLTGLSAVFPNRIHVPTNDYYYNQNHNNIRGKRSVDDYTGRQINEVLQPEHRSMDEEAYPAYRSYNFEIGSPRGKFVDQSQQHAYNEFASMSNFDTSYGRKNSGFIHNKHLIHHNHQNPEEHESYNQGHKEYHNFDSSLSPSSIATPTVVAAPDILLNSVDYSFPEKTQRKMRTRTRVKVRAGNKRKSRPLPTEPPLSIPSNIQELQSHLIGAEKISKVRNIGSRRAFKQHEPAETVQQSEKSAPVGTFRLGDQYLKSIVEHHEIPTATPKQVDLSPDGAVMGLITSYAQHDRDSPDCQKKALCELAIKGKNPTATKFETFLWSLATLVPEQFSKIYELDDIFQAVQRGSCEAFQCVSPNLDLQV